MSTAIPLRANGEVIDQNWYNVIRSEVSTLDDRVDALGSNQSLSFDALGNYNAAGSTGSLDGVIVHKVTQSITLTSAVLHIITAGSAGSTKVMLERKRTTGSWLSLFSTAPIVPASAGDNANSGQGSAGVTAAVIIASLQTIIPGDLLRLNIQQAQMGTPDTFLLTVYHTTDGV